MRRLLITILIFCGAVMGYAKGVKYVQGQATFYIPTDMTYDHALEEVIRLAKINALNNAFGNTIGVSNTLILTESTESFYSNGFDFVRGEWIETIGEPKIKKDIDNDMFCVTCIIKGKAREKKTINTNLYAATLRNGITADCESTDFKNGNKLYLAFKSPVNGYISVYLHDHAAQSVYCLLPYRKQGVGSVCVEHDKEYVFFSKDASTQPRLVDEYTLGCSKEVEVNTLYILFSPNQFDKTLSDSSDKFTPRQLSFDDFVAWKARCQSQDPSFQVVVRDLTIRK